MSFKSFMESLLPSIHVKAETLAPQSSYVSNGVGFAWGAITFNQWVMAITLLLGVLTFVVNLYFQSKRNQREKARERRDEELHLKRMAESLNNKSEHTEQD